MGMENQNVSQVIGAIELDLSSTSCWRMMRSQRGEIYGQPEPLDEAFPFWHCTNM